MSLTDVVPVVKTAAEELQKEFGIEIAKSVIEKANETFLEILEKCPGNKFTSQQKKAIAKAVLVVSSAVITFGVSAVASVILGVVSHGSTSIGNLAGIPVLAVLAKALPYLAGSRVSGKQVMGTLFAVRQTSADIAMLKQLTTYLKTTLLPILPKQIKTAVEKGTEAVAKDEIKKGMKKIFNGKKKVTAKIDQAKDIGKRAGILSEA